MKAVLVCALAILLPACGPAVPGPAALDTHNDACSECRMTVSNPRFASQLVAPGEEPRFFDDLGCLAAYLRDHERMPPGAVAYVADHQSREWVPPSAAVFTLVPGLETPMGSHVVAHASASSRDADPASQRGTPVEQRAFFGSPLPDGTR
jgi:copper chaperone NosL